MNKLITLSLWLLFSIVTSTVLAEDPKPTPKPQPTPEDKPVDESKKTDEKFDEEDTDKKEEEEKEEEEKDRYSAVKASVVHTVTRGDLYDVTILSKNGKIIEIGTNVDLPEETEVLDATGYHIYPGLVAVTGGNILGSQPPDETTNVYSLQMEIALAGGITTGVSGETAAKLSFGSTDDMIVKRRVKKGRK